MSIKRIHSVKVDKKVANETNEVRYNSRILLMARRGNSPTNQALIGLQKLNPPCRELLNPGCPENPWN